MSIVSVNNCFKNYGINETLDALSDLMNIVAKYKLEERNKPAKINSRPTISEHDKPKYRSGSFDYKKSLTRMCYNIFDRCYNKNNPNFKNYGGRGIKVTCADLPYELENIIISTIGYPKEGEVIDRINNNDNYTAENIRYTTPTKSSINRRTSYLKYNDYILAALLSSFFSITSKGIMEIFIKEKKFSRNVSISCNYGSFVELVTNNKNNALK